jgi:uncharacterized membrane protein YedE/YeeE
MVTAMATQIAICPTKSWAAYSTLLRTDSANEKDPGMGALLIILPLCLATLIAPSMAKKKEKTDEKKEGMGKMIPAAVSGVMFASGLAISQMTVQSKLFGFLDICGLRSGSWDPTLVTVLGAAVPVSMIFYQFVEGWGVTKNSKALKRPICAPKFSIPTNTDIDKNLILGASIFGVGWAMGCLCPGPALFAAAIGNKPIIFNWVPAFFVGAVCALKYKESQSKK